MEKAAVFGLRTPVDHILLQDWSDAHVYEYTFHQQALIPASPALIT